VWLAIDLDRMGARMGRQGRSCTGPVLVPNQWRLSNWVGSPLPRHPAELHRMGRTSVSDWRLRARWRPASGLPLAQEGRARGRGAGVRGL